MKVIMRQTGGVVWVWAPASVQGVEEPSFLQNAESSITDFSASFIAWMLKWTERNFSFKLPQDLACV